MKTLLIIMMVMLIMSQSFAQEFEDSPFGFHPASVYHPGYANNGFSDAQNIGVRWHRPPIYAFWFIVQPDTGDTTLDFSMYDQIYGAVPTGINILANIAPQGHINEGYSKPGSYLPIDSAKYVRFVKATVERYDGDGIDDMPGLVNPIKYWQVGNEPLATIPSGFVQLQRITYQAIKDACPESKVLIGGTLQPITPSGFTVDDEEYFNWFSIFYEPILTELNGNYVDIFDLHWYGNATGDYRYSGAVLDSLKTILLEYNFGEIPIWITEMGSYSGDPIGPAFSYQSERQQAGDYLKRFVFSLSVGIKKVFPAFGLMEGFIDDDGYFDHTGLIYDGEGSNDLGLGVKKLAYFSYKLMTGKLEGSDWDNIQTLINGKDNVYAYKFTRTETGKPVYVVWWDWFNESGYSGGDTKITSFEVGDVDSIIVTEAVPAVESGADLNENEYPDFFASEIKPVVNGTATITLGENPVFVEELSSLTSVGEGTGWFVPGDFQLEQNYPNPFNPQTTIAYQIPISSHVVLRIFNVIGQEVRTLMDQNQSVGNYSVKWDGKDDFGVDTASGIFFYQMRTESFVQTKKLLLLK